MSMSRNDRYQKINKTSHDKNEIETYPQTSHLFKSQKRDDAYVLLVKLNNKFHEFEWICVMIYIDMDSLFSDKCFEMA